MIIAFTAQGDNWDAPMDPRFGRTRFLLVYDDEADTLGVLDNEAVANEAHGAGPRTASLLLENGADVLITGNGPGGNAGRALAGRVKVFAGAAEGTAREALARFRAGELKEFAI